MPAPVVYVVAVIASVGAVLAFKQFVYDPYFHDQVVTLVDELHDARRRRRSPGQPLPVSVPNSGDDDDDSQPLVPLSTSRQQTSRSNEDGSLRRRRQPGAGAVHDSDEERHGVAYGIPPRHVGAVSNRDIELADLAPEIREWNGPTGLAGTRSPLDESNHSIPFTPLQPSHGPSSATAFASPRLAEETHVIANEDSPATTPSSTPSMVRRMQALPQVPQSTEADSVLFSANKRQEEQVRSDSPAHTDLSSLVTSPPLPPSFLPPTSARASPAMAIDIPGPRRREPELESTPASVSSSLATPIAVTPLARPLPRYVPSESEAESPGALSSPTTSVSPTSYRQTFPAHITTSPSITASSLSSPVSLPPSIPSPTEERSASTSASPPLRPSIVPSLSQIYPQDLDSEHNVVLLSPPSSRSESPFSVVSAGAASPRGVASPRNNFNSRTVLISHRAASNASPDPQEALRTPGSTTSNYLSLADDPSTSPSTPRSPTAELHARHSSDGGSESEYDVISNTTSLSPFNSPMNSSSPFNLSPFASPRLGAEGGQARQLGPAGYQQLQQQHQLLSANLSPGHTQEQNAQQGSRPPSPADSTTSLSDLDILEYDGAW